ncbi:MAG: UDP-N-acetylmuramate dehydrogenase [Deltaproteobacteria bacterium]
MNSQRSIKNRLRRDVPLAARSYLRIGGYARWWLEPADGRALAAFLRRRDAVRALFVLGAGSNVLFDDGRIDKVFVSLSRPAFTGIRVRGRCVTAGAGVRLGRLISALTRHDLGGHEFLAGIPGTLGGALAMNAGARTMPGDPATYREIGDIVVSVDVMDAGGRRRTLAAREMEFGYRATSLKGAIVTGATLRLHAARRQEVTRRIGQIIGWRFAHQDWLYPSAGSFFKNPPGDRAGRLIDLCGLKGHAVGGAQVSPRHANFIINTGGARCADVIKLMEIIQEKVYNHFRVHLEPEVVIVRAQ